MSIQHRSRIKSIADYTSNANSLGACCYARADSPVEEYYNTCVANGGHWQPYKDAVDEIACPDLGATGCCCSCSYVDNWGEGINAPAGATGFFEAYGPSSNKCEMLDTDNPELAFPCYQGGLRDNITFCECSDRGGVWAKGMSCGAYTEIVEYEPGVPNTPDCVRVGAHRLCTMGGEIPDVRWPGACCSDSTCVTTCSPKECAVVGNAHGATGISWNPNNYCFMPGGDDWYDPNCPDNCQGPDIVLSGCGNREQYTEGESKGFYEKDKRSGVYIAKGDINDLLFDNYSDTLKSSCSYLKSKELVCSSETKTVCDEYKGIWSGYNKDGKQIQCSDTTTTDIQTYMTNKSKIPRSTINTWKLGDRVLGRGRYVGEFIIADDTHSPGSECFGTSENTGICYPYYPKNNNNTKNSNKTFAIIIAENDFGGSSLAYEPNLNSSNVSSSSNWDSWYNHTRNNLNLTKNINRTYNKNIWWSWGIASKDLWGFISNQVNDLDFISNTTISDETPNFLYTPLLKGNSTFYWSSTFEASFNYGTKTQLAYCQSFGDSPMVVLSRRDNKHFARAVLSIELVED